MSHLPENKDSKKVIVDKLLTSFEEFKHIDDDGVEFWLARELAPLLGYKRWENFEAAIGRARIACGNVGEDVEDHFRGVTKMVDIGSGAKREQQDYELTRFASYLIAMNGDPAKDEIAAAQTYFAVQTRRQEMADIAAAQRPPLSEDERRLLLRDEIKHHNKSLASAAKSHGVAKPVEYAVFQNEGYKGLYGGLDKTGIQRRKKLTEKQDILDHMPSAELAANLFRATQTEEQLDRLRQRGETGKSVANKTHFEIGKKVRNTIQEIGGTMPENYQAAEHIKEARKRIKVEKKKQLPKNA
ncbi:MAG TPA: DNA damage-inducible protein D [Hyphomicrobiales bacterium]|jgi:DNA-damage-inducible protein D